MFKSISLCLWLSHCHWSLRWVVWFSCSTFLLCGEIRCTRRLFNMNPILIHKMRSERSLLLLSLWGWLLLLWLFLHLFHSLCLLRLCLIRFNLLRTLFPFAFFGYWFLLFYRMEFMFLLLIMVDLWHFIKCLLSCLHWFLLKLLPLWLRTSLNSFEFLHKIFTLLIGDLFILRLCLILLYIWFNRFLVKVTLFF